MVQLNKLDCCLYMKVLVMVMKVLVMVMKVLVMIMKVLVMVMKVLVMVNLRDTFEERVVCYKSYLSWKTVPNSQFGG